MNLRRKPHVLVISTKLDTATDAVVARLHESQVAVTRINTEELPFEAALTLEVGSAINGLQGRYRPWEHERREFDLATSCFYRRIRIPARPAGMETGVYNFCLRETRATLLGCLLGRPIPFMNDPARVWEAEVKPFQLNVAKQLGLSIPATVVSNDPEEIRHAFDAFGGRMVAKPVRSGYVEHGGTPRAIFTSLVTSDDLADDAALRASPAIYQELIPKRCDLRVTVVGDRLFSAEIDSQGDPNAQIDWRRTTDPLLPHRAVELPEHIHRGLLKLADRLGLVFAAIDLIRTPANEYVFLEVNPAGQWLWLEDALGLPITSAISAWLVEATGSFQLR